MLRALAAACLLLIGCRPSPASAPAGPPDPPGSPASTTATADSPGNPPPTGSIDKNDIRDVVRAHIGDVRACYNHGLASDPDLAGRVTLQFTIAPEGDVSSVVIHESTLPPAAARVGECIAAAARGWAFPAPKGGSVVVTYPFVLTTSDPVVSLTGLLRGEHQPGRWYPVRGYSAGALVVEVLADGGKSSAAGVQLTLTSHTRDGDLTRSAVTDGRGLAVFEDLPSSGTAIVELTAPGGKKELSEPASLGRGSLATLLVVGSPR